MNIYFTTSVKSSIEKHKEIAKILSVLQENNKVDLRPKLINATDINQNKVNFEEAAGLEFLSQDHSIQDIFLLSQKRITRSDLIIGEMTYESTGLGYDIAQASLQNKPILILYDQKISKLSNNPIFGNESNRIFIENYLLDNNQDIIKEVIQNFMFQAKRLLDSKFILIIPPEIERYLSWASNKKGIRKAEIVRDAMDNFIEKDKDYDNYLKDLEK